MKGTKKEEEAEERGVPNCLVSWKVGNNGRECLHIVKKKKKGRSRLLPPPSSPPREEDFCNEEARIFSGGKNQNSKSDVPIAVTTSSSGITREGNLLPLTKKTKVPKQRGGEKQYRIQLDRAISQTEHLTEKDTVCSRPNNSK